MHALSATELLSVWESGSSQIPLRTRAYNSRQLPVPKRQRIRSPI